MFVQSQARAYILESAEEKAQVCSQWLSRASPCCRFPERLGPGGGGARGMGAGAAEGRAAGPGPLAALRQQGALGGDHGGGRLQADRISRERERGVLHLHHHEHGQQFGKI